MQGTMRFLVAMIIGVGLLAGGGCSPRSSEKPVGEAPPAEKAKEPTFTLPMTLPVLDAFFADSTFVGQVKKELKLTDAQIEKLRQLARQETASLQESELDQQPGSTRAATARATEEITKIIGEEKTRELAALITERWSDGSSLTVAESPNAVPQDTRIIVNAPAYRMDVFEQGRLVKSYKVGIGYPEFPLPTGARVATSIIYNPTWTPPDEPWVRSSDKYQPGETIEPGSKLNPLGPVKIPIGLPSLIHGGKAPARLGGFASHGCVGLTNRQVQDFAKLLARLGGATLTPQQIASYEKNRTETRTVPLDRPILVELRYETIVVEDGKLSIYRDVYDRKTNTEEHLAKVLGAHGVNLNQLTPAERAQINDALQQMSYRPQPKSGQVTRETQKLKHLVIPVGTLAGKGYPAPVDLDEGKPNKQNAPVQAADSGQPARQRERAF